MYLLKRPLLPITNKSIMYKMASPTFFWLGSGCGSVNSNASLNVVIGIISKWKYILLPVEKTKKKKDVGNSPFLEKNLLVLCYAPVVKSNKFLTKACFVHFATSENGTYTRNKSTIIISDKSKEIKISRRWYALKLVMIT